MTRGTSEILPFCPHCGQYKGIGDCQNPDCHETAEGKSIINNTMTKCLICSSKGVVSCSVCKQMYCDKHSAGMNETRLIAIDQHIGTCEICGKTVCENCWIFDKKGKITCLKHSESKIV